MDIHVPEAEFFVYYVGETFGHLAMPGAIMAILQIDMYLNYAQTN